ncbi:SCN10A, partial [Symbiodinium necroappetens]
ASKSQSQPDYRSSRTTSSNVLSPATCPTLFSRMCPSWRNGFQDRADGKSQGIFEAVNDLKHSTSKPSNGKEQKFADNVFGRIAGHRYFEGATMAVILVNAVCIGIDADYSATNDRPAKLYEGPAFFIVTEVFFAVFFTTELVVRFLAFKRKCLCFCDFWFLFDFLLVAMMDVETFILPLIASEGGPLGILSTLRLLRLLRVSRMAKLMRTFPELMLIVKGLAAAVRAVSWTLALLMMILFVWSIIFTSIYHQGTKTDEEVADGIGSLFGNMSKSAFSLIIMGTLLDDVTYCCNMIRESGQIFMLAVFIVFIVISSFMMLNMLLGILVEVVASTAEGWY